MRDKPLSREEKEAVETLLRKLGLAPPVAGQILFNIDGNGKVASAELARVVWR